MGLLLGWHGAIVLALDFLRAALVNQLCACTGGESRNNALSIVVGHDADPETVKDTINVSHSGVPAILLARFLTGLSGAPELEFWVQV